MITKKSIAKIVRYLIVGFSAYIAEIAVLYFLNKILNWPGIYAVAVSFWVGFLWAFVAQKIITFKNTNQPNNIIAKQLFIYSLLVIFNYIFSLLMVAVLQNHLSVIIIRSIAVIIIISWNYIIYNKVIFKNKNNE